LPGVTTFREQDQDLENNLHPALKLLTSRQL